MIQAVLHDLRDDSATHGVTVAYCMGELNPLVVTIPHGVAHGYRVLGVEPAWLVYHTSIPYDAANPDEERIAYDDPGIGFDWTTQPR
jgi:dTDP-4-dehydrorhamnose 3,5-epimerase